MVPGDAEVHAGSQSGAQARHHVLMTVSPTPASSLTDRQTLSRESLSHDLEFSTPEKTKHAQLDCPGELGGAGQVGGRLELCWDAGGAPGAPRKMGEEQVLILLVPTLPGTPPSSFFMATSATIRAWHGGREWGEEFCRKSGKERSWRMDTARASSGPSRVCCVTLEAQISSTLRLLAWITGAQGRQMGGG